MRPAWGAGIRAAIATVAPLLAASALGLPGGEWMMLAGFSVALADKGGAYRTRAAAMIALSVSGAAAAIIGALASTHAILAVAIVLLWTTVWCIPRVLGNAGASVGTSTIVILLISISAPTTSLGEAATRAIATLVGGAWAMLLSLALWPIRPYRPARAAVATAYRHLGSYARDLASSIDAGGSPTLSLRVERATLRDEIDRAREVVADVRRGRAGETPRGERLLMLVEIADQLFGTLIALTDTYDSAPQQGASARLSDFAERADSIARTAMAETRLGRSIAMRTIGDGGNAPSGTTTPTTLGAAMLARLEDDASMAGDLANTLESATSPSVSDMSPTAAASAPSAWHLLRVAIAPRSTALHHALRVGLVTAAATALVRAIGLERGYWVTLTAVIILQPSMGSTYVKALQRVVGTVIGGALTAALASVLHTPNAILVLTFVLSAVCIAFLPVNYALYSVILTPAFVLIAEVSAGDWHLAGVRIVNTIIGGGLALVGAVVLWPEREQERFGRYAGESLRAAAAHLRTVAANWTRLDAAAEAAIAAARRTAGVAAINAEGSVERLLAERGPRSRRAEPAMAIAAYARRLVVAATGLAAARFTPGAAGVSAEVERFASLASAELDALAASAEQLGQASAETPPVELPRIAPVREAAEAVSDPLVAPQLERLARAVSVIRQALERVAGPQRSRGETAEDAKAWESSIG